MSQIVLDGGAAESPVELTIKVDAPRAGLPPAIRMAATARIAIKIGPVVFKSLLPYAFAAIFLCEERRPWLQVI